MKNCYSEGPLFGTYAILTLTRIADLRNSGPVPKNHTANLRDRAVYNVSSVSRTLLPTGVRVGVFLHVGLLVERLAAERTMERSYVAVDQQVRAQSGRASESLAAALARVRPVGTVLHPVPSQTRHVTERLVTRDTLERSLAWYVRPPRMYLAHAQFL